MGLSLGRLLDLLQKHILNDADEFEQLAVRFVKETKAEMQHYSLEEIMNTNQVGLGKELHSTRTLSYRGEKLTVAAIKSKNAITHSCTLQPMINLAGEVVGPIYLCLKEPNGWISESESAHSFYFSN